MELDVGMSNPGQTGDVTYLPIRSESGASGNYGDLLVASSPSSVLMTSINDSTTLAGAGEEFAPGLSLAMTIVVSLVCGTICIGTLVGNFLVILAVCLVKKLQDRYNSLIVSLAVSDFLVGLVVMPFSIIQEVKGHWVFNDLICDLWTSSDILLCTASILSLCAISMYRFYQIKYPFIIEYSNVYSFDQQ